MRTVTEWIISGITKGINSTLDFIKGVKLEELAKLPEKPVEETPSKVVVTLKSTLAERAKQFNMSFGGACITENDWKFIKSTVEKYDVKTVLEFGAGLSTIFLSDIVEKLVSYESAPVWLKKSKEHLEILIKESPEKADIIDLRLWNGKEIEEPLDNFDMAFVDGPAQSSKSSRDISTKIASEHAKLVLVHDAGREFEMKWQLAHLQSNFFLQAKGGNRCTLWIRKDSPHAPEDHKTSLIRYGIVLGKDVGGPGVDKI